MSVEIYHNPRCSKSRQTLRLLQYLGMATEVAEYLMAAIRRPPEKLLEIY